MLEHLRLPCGATVAAIVLSAVVFKKFLKKRASRSAVKGSADNDSATENGTAERAAPSRPSPRVEETATSSSYDYEVFLSFRGPDTRSSFTDYLYTSLTDAGIRTFKDDEGLHIGEEFAPELLQAINQSKISIPIFSKNYASSIWCLKEVVQMVERKKTGGHKIMPIFYDVAPSEVRYQSGIYEKAFHSHKEKRRYGEETINQWKAALSAVGEINGWDLHSEKNRREGDFIGKLTQKVFNELKQPYLVVSDCLVNVDNHVDAIMEKIGAQTSETWIMGIHGMGGIGKTTIAKIIYNQLSNNFDDCCFLSNIREMSECKGIEYLQNQLISNILKKKCRDIRNIDDGIKIIKDRLSNKRVLLLLDDVHEKNHMNALVGKGDWFGRGSKLLITTRNKEVLDVLEVDDHYELTGMDRSQSLQLFSKHAFRRDSPLDEYIDQSNRVIDIAKGLPLALEVIGSLLSHTKKREWNDILAKLENVPHTEVQSNLKISYDALEVRHKHIFLDIACLFIGYNKDVIVHFWEKSKYFPEEAMEVLQNLSLIKIEEDNRVWMHDQLRDLGREIVYQESDTKIKKQSRVWDPKEGLELLRKHKGKKRVEALRLKLDNQQQYHFSYEDFENLSDLRFLEVNGSMENFHVEERLLWHESSSNVFPTNENSNLLPQLRWLTLRDIPPTFNITNFSMEDVVILDLSQSKIMDDWKGWTHMKVMKNLKVLDMSNCQGLQRTPNLSTLLNLERLILKYCQSLIEIDRSICQLKCLVSLNVSYCRNLQRLPDSIGSLESLIELDISDTSIEELPDSIRNLKKLKVVTMLGSKLSKIPNVLWSMGDLEDMRASGGYGNRHFQVQIGNGGICSSQSLRIFILEGADICALPRLPESLINLKLSILRMDTFPDLSNLTNLKKMDIDFGRPHHDVIFDGLGEHPMPWWIGNLSKLEFLALRSSHVTTSPTNLSLAPQLKSLCLMCPNLRHLPKLPSSLSSLDLKDCKSLCSMEDLSNLKKLSSLRIRSAAVVEIQGLGCLENLRDLELYWLAQVEILPDLSNSNNLASLEVGHCDKLVEIQGHLPRFLARFYVGCCGSLQKLPDLSSLMGKQVFVLRECKKLNVETILDVARLNSQHFQFVNFEELQILPDLSNSNELRCLQVGRCDNLVEIQGELPQSLEELRFHSCKSLQKLPYLSSLMGLREVDIRNCDNLIEIQGELPQSLEELRFHSCKSLQKLPYLSSSMGLRQVDIQNCDNLVEIQGELPQSLKELRFYSCKSLQKLPYLSSSMGLRNVDIHDCDNLVEIQGELSQSLTELRFHSCKSLQKLPYLSSSMGLRKIDIHNCDNLIEIQGELSQSLKELRFHSCKSLRKLPYLSSLMGLREIDIHNCDNLLEIQGELPQSLEELRLHSCKSLQKLPYLSSSIGLREVDIHNCDNLAEIQGKLPLSLEELRLHSCKSLQKLAYLSSSMELRKVDIHNCGNLVEIQGELPQFLKELRLHSCKSLQKLPYLSSLMGLREVDIHNCDNLVEIQGELPQSLEELRLHSCKSLQKLAYMSSLMGLRKVDIHNCDNLAEIQGELPLSLEELRLHSCKSLQKLAYLSSSMGLRKVDIHNCGNLVEIQGELPQSLEELRFHSCKSLQKLPYLSSSMGLREVDIHNCDNLVEIQGEVPRSLEELKFHSCKSLQKLPYLSSLMGLRKVDIHNCDNLVGIQGEVPQSLEELRLHSCKSLKKLPYMSNLMRLREVDIHNCDNLVEIQGELPQSLEELRFHSCKSLQNLPYLSSLMGLREVDIRNCDNLVEIQGKLPQSLKELRFHSCKSLQKLPYLSSSMRLREIDIHNCDNLVEIQGKLPESLKELKLHSCKSLQKLPYLSSSMELRKVDIHICENLVEIQGEVPQSLEELRFHSCKSLQKLPYLSSSMGLREVNLHNCDNLVEIQGELPQSLKELRFHSCKSLQKLPYLSSSMELREVKIHNCDNLVEIQGELPQSLEVLDIYKCQSLQELPNLSSLKGLRKAKIIHCRKLNVEAISSLCLEMSAKFVEVDVE